jgi:hypothetical protein
MTNTRRADRLLLLTLVVLAVLLSVLAAVLAPPPRAGSPDERPSTFFNAPHGTKAAYLALGRLGQAPQRLRRPIDRDTLEGVNALIILRPVVELTSYERHTLLAWVEAGHRLLVAPAAPDPRGHAGRGLADWFKFTTSDNRPASTLPATASTFEPPGDDLLAGIRCLTARAGQRFKGDGLLAGDLAELQATPVWSDDAGVVAARIPYGTGTIIALSDVYALTNAGLSEADNPLWLANLALALRGADDTAVLAFDEYHAGFPYRAPSWAAIAQLLLTEGWSPSVVQLLLVSGLALWAGAVRFGRPRDVHYQPRRRQSEFARAAGQLLLRAGATALAHETLSAHYRARLCRVLHLSTTVDDAHLAATLAARGRADLLAALQPPAGAARSSPLTARQLLDFSRKLHRELEALEHGS